MQAINADHAGGTPFDLSGDGRVARGMYSAPPRLPFVCVGSPDVQSQPGPELSRYERTATIDVLAWTSSTAADLTTRIETAETLLDKLMSALEDARNTRGNALREPRGFLVKGASYPGDMDDLGGSTVMVQLVIELQWKRTTGLSA